MKFVGMMTKVIHLIIPEYIGTFLFELLFLFSLRAGLIGKAIIQIPVEGGHRGGRITVRYKKKAAVFITSDNSHSKFYLTTFYKGCRYSMEPITSGTKLSFIFSVVWKNELKESPKDMLSVMSSYKLMKDALNNWIPLQEVVNSQGDDHLGNKYSK